MNTDKTVTLFRPTGPNELRLVEESGFRKWPPRLPGQPFFYPVTNEGYATQIARDWNVKESGSGYVTRFAVRESFMSAFPIQTVGGSQHTEYWIPAASVDEMNRNIVGLIEVVRRFPDDHK